MGAKPHRAAASGRRERTAIANRRGAPALGRRYRELHATKSALIMLA
jgi:hypothetical protein